MPAKFGSQTRQIGSQTVTLLEYRGQLFVPADALSLLGITLSFDRHLLCKQVSSSNSGNYKSSQPQGLVLERGHRFENGTDIAYLVSVKDQLFFPVQKIALLGLVENHSKIEKP